MRAACTGSQSLCPRSLRGSAPLSPNYPLQSAGGLRGPDVEADRGSRQGDVYVFNKEPRARLTFLFFAKFAQKSSCQLRRGCGREGARESAPTTRNEKEKKSELI